MSNLESSILAFLDRDADDTGDGPEVHEVTEGDAEALVAELPAIERRPVVHERVLPHTRSGKRVTA